MLPAMIKVSGGTRARERRATAFSLWCGFAVAFAGLFSPGLARAVTFSIGNVSGGAGSQVLVPVTVSQFSNVSVFQYSMHWNTSVATFIGVEQFGLSGLAGGNFGTTSAG